MKQEIFFLCLIIVSSTASGVRGVPEFVQGKVFENSNDNMFSFLHGDDLKTHSVLDLGFVPDQSRELPSVMYAIVALSSTQAACTANTPFITTGNTATGNCFLATPHTNNVAGTPYSKTVTISISGNAVTKTTTKYTGTSCTGPAVSDPPETYKIGVCSDMSGSGTQWMNVLSAGSGYVPAYSASSPTYVSQSFSNIDKTCTTPLSWYAYTGCSETFSSGSSASSGSVKPGCSMGTLSYSLYANNVCSGTPTESTSRSIGPCSARSSSSSNGDDSSESAYTLETCALPPEDSKKVAACFSGDEKVTLEGGVMKPLSEVALGDRVLTANAVGALSYSPVVFLPHGANAQEAQFIEFATAGGKALKTTPLHLIRMCEGALSYAGSLKAGSCVKTVDGNEAVVSVTRVIAKGLYTAVTENEFLVVNGVVASPFAVTHGVTHAFYGLHRALYKLAPSFMKSPAVVTANALLGSAAVLGIRFVSSK